MGLEIPLQLHHALVKIEERVLAVGDQVEAGHKNAGANFSAVIANQRVIVEALNEINGRLQAIEDRLG